LSFHSNDAEDSRLPGCYGIVTGKYLPTFQRITVPSSSGSSSLTLEILKHSQLQTIHFRQ